jgi:hypothetical protein
MERVVVRPTKQSVATTYCSMGDVLAAAAGTPHLAFCYAERLEPRRLSEALALVLSDYAVYAGRLSYQRGSWRIENGAGGTAFEVTDSPMSSHALGAAAHAQHSKLVCPTIHASRAVRGAEPLFAARLTQTRDGSVLGVTWLHMVGDTHSTMLLLRAWALAYRGQAYELPVVVSDRDAYLSANIPRTSRQEGAGLRRLSWTQLTGLLWYYATHPGKRLNLEFSWQDIECIREAAARERSVTVNDALCAHVFATIRRLQRLGASSQLALSVNYRKRLGLPANLLGNMVDLVGTTAQPSDDVAAIAAGLRSRIESFSAGPLGHHGLMELKATNPSRSELMRSTVEYLDPRRGNLMITSWANFGIYELVFQSSRPVFVHCRNAEKVLASWFGCVFESPGDRGLTMTLWLPAGLARQLEAELAHATASVLRDNAAVVRDRARQVASVER